METVVRSKILPVKKEAHVIPEGYNPVIVDDSGYIPLGTLVSRLERSGELKSMYQRLANPNNSLNRVIEDFSMLEEKGDSLEVMAFAKAALESVRSKYPDLAKQIPAGRLHQNEVAEDLFSKL